MPDIVARKVVTLQEDEEMIQRHNSVLQMLDNYNSIPYYQEGNIRGVVHGRNVEEFKVIVEEKNVENLKIYALPMKILGHVTGN